MHLKMVAGIIIFLLFSCQGGHSFQNGQLVRADSMPAVEQPSRISAIPSPEGYSRTGAGSASFANWLRARDLKKDNTVYLYDGTVKPNQSAQFAVLDISVGNKNLQQCADAVMRLRAEYLFAFELYSEISFTDNEGGIYKFDAPYTRDRFSKYLERVFGMCGTASLSKQMRTVKMQQMQPGDVLVKGGFPGHAVIVMDMAENEKGEKIYLLAQSYMPAQDIHILKNPSDEDLSPWYRLNDHTDIITPEYYFTSDQLKSW
jgi:hypothetical protein